MRNNYQLQISISDIVGLKNIKKNPFQKFKLVERKESGKKKSPRKKSTNCIWWEKFYLLVTDLVQFELINLHALSNSFLLIHSMLSEIQNQKPQNRKYVIFQFLFNLRKYSQNIESFLKLKSERNRNLDF